MAKAPKAPIQTLDEPIPPLGGTTTGVLVKVDTLSWQALGGSESPDFFTMNCTCEANGVSSRFPIYPVVAKNATDNAKTVAIKAAVNAYLAANEPLAGNLGNAAIQVSGQPV